MTIPGLREQKKRATSRALASAAYTLIREHGLDEVTTDDIAALAGFSRRTFANYYSCKQEAVVDGFFVAVGLGDDPFSTSTNITLPVDFDAFIDLAQQYVANTFTGVNLTHMRDFATLVRDHGSIEPYLLKSLQTICLSSHHEELAERFGEMRLKMFFGATLGMLHSVAEAFIAPAESTPGEQGTPVVQVDPGDLHAIVDHTFKYLRHGFNTSAP